MMISLLRLKTHIAIGVMAIGLVAGIPAMGWATVPLLPTVTPVPTTATSVPFGSNDPDVPNLAQFGRSEERRVGKECRL